MVKESFGTITMQFTLAPVRNRNLSYVFSGPTNILGFSNLSNLSLNYFFLLFLVGCWPTHASGVITPSSSDTMQRAEIWAWAHRWWLEHRTFSGKQYLSRSRLWIRYPDLQNISFALQYSHLSVVYTSTFCAPFSGRKTESLIQFWNWNFRIMFFHFFKVEVFNII